jgi:hypothetical protein
MMDQSKRAEGDRPSLLQPKEERVASHELLGVASEGTFSAGGRARECGAKRSLRRLEYLPIPTVSRCAVWPSQVARVRLREQRLG